MPFTDSITGASVIHFLENTAPGAIPAPLETPDDVKVRIDGYLAVTEIEQTFFNPRSEYLEGVYAVRLPESAILESFAVGTEDESPACFVMALVIQS